MRWMFIVLVLVLRVNCASAQANSRTFTSVDGAFRFQYPSSLLRCRQKRNQPDVWLPIESCNGYDPVCDDHGADPGSTTLVCFAYPMEKYENSDLEGAAFYVAEVQSKDRRDCLSGSPNWAPGMRRGPEKAMINGVKFTAFEIGDAGLGHYLEGDVYRSFHRNKCYSLSIRVASSYNPDNIKALSNEQWNEVRSSLKRVLDSFKFLR